MAIASGVRTGFMSAEIAVETHGAREFIDITDEVADLVTEWGVRDGLALVASQHTTAAVVINEHEPELLKDLDRMLSELAPTDGRYAHNSAPCEPGEGPNGHAHCQALLLSASTSLPVSQGRLVLGRYQRIFIVELDRPRLRRVTVALLGV